MSERSGAQKKRSGFSTTAIAALLVAGLGAYAYFGEYKGGQKKDEQKQKDAIVLKFDADKAVRIEIVNHDTTTVLEKTADGWHLVAPQKDAADAAVVNGLLGSLSTERVAETIAEGVDFQAAKYGLVTPTGHITVKTEDGKSHQINIGSKSYDASLYAQVDGEQKAILVSNAWDVNLAKQPKELRDRRLLRTDSMIDYDSLEINVLKPVATKLKLQKVDAKWTWVDPPSNGFPISQDDVQSYLDKLKALRADEFPFEDKTDRAVLKKLGFTSPRISVSLRNSKKADAKEWTLAIAASADDAKGQAGKLTEPGQMVIAISSDVPALSQISKAAGDALARSADDVYDRRAPFRFDSANARLATIRAGGVVIEAKKSGDVWVLADKDQAARPKQELDSTKMLGLILKLGQLRVDRVLKSATPRGLEPAKNSIVFKSEKGDVLIDFAWGERYHPTESKSGIEDYFARTVVKDAPKMPKFGLAVADVDALPVKELIKEKPQPTPAPTATPAVTGTTSPKAPAPPK